MLDKLADPLRLGFMSTIIKCKVLIKFETLLYRHFKNTRHSPSKIIIHSVEKLHMILIPNKNIKRHET